MANPIISVYKCDGCGILSPSMEVFRQHLCGDSVTISNNSVLSPYECCHCFMQFPSLEGLNAHTCTTAEEPTARKVCWSAGMVKCFLTVYVKYQDQLVDVDHKTKRIFNIIAQEMGLLGFPGISGEMCQEKWKSLKRRYKIIIDKKSKTGTAAHRFLYFKEMDEILGKCPDINPPVTYNSSHSGPTYRADSAAAVPGSSSMTCLNNETLRTCQQQSQSPQQSQSQQSPTTHGLEDSLEETPTPKRAQRRELPYWSRVYFKKIDAIEANRAEENRKKEEREKRRDQIRERIEEARERREEARERRANERQKRHEDKQKLREKMLNVLQNISNNK